MKNSLLIHYFLVNLVFFYVFETLVVYVGECLCMHALAHVCRLLPMYVDRGPLWSFYFRKWIFAHLKGYIFHFNTP